MTLTHRCIDCPLRNESEPEDLCPSCGRCLLHCHQDNHTLMTRRADPRDRDLLLLKGS